VATFHLQVEALTGIDIDGSSSPTQTELGYFLKDGVLDVTNKTLATQPERSEEFQTVSAEQTSNDNFTTNGRILSVVREAEVNDDWRRCTQVPAHMQSRVTDKDSLFYASSYNPVYIVGGNSNISVFPTPGSTTKAFKVYYISNDPKGDGVADELAAGHSSIGYFPKDLVHLVVLYASIKSLENAMSAKTLTDDLTIPVLPTITAPTSLSAPSFSYVEQVMGDLFQSTITTFIDTDEDTELSAAKVQQAGVNINSFQVKLENALNKMNEEVQEYTAKLQRYEKESGYEVAKYQQEASNKVGLFQAQVQDFSSKINKYTTDYTWMQGRYTSLLQQYMAAFPAPQQQRGQ
jgi:hypothetical protein